MFELMPFGRENRNLWNYFDDMEKSFFNSFQNGLSRVRTDVLDKGDRYVLEAELPGFDKKDIHIGVQNNCLTIQAQHSEKQEQKDEENGRYICRERSYGSYSRSFDLSGIKEDEIKASYDNGILTVTMPKDMQKEKTNGRRIDIE